VTRSPYQSWAPNYVDLGWSPIPLPTRQKHPVPKNPSVTGAEGVYIDQDRLLELGWLKPRARVHVGELAYFPGNIALRLPQNVIGVDVDAYEGKAGAATLAAAEADWGKLPPTWSTTSRIGDPVSGLRLFQLPAHGLHLAWPGELPQGKGVELIRWDHRYAIVAPSEHDKGTNPRYCWVTPEGEYISLHDLGEDDEVELPAPEDLELLPDTWIAGLTAGREYTAGVTPGGRNNAVGAEGELPADEVDAWCVGRDSGNRAALGGAYANGMCPGMERTLNQWLLAVRRAGDDGGAHDASRNGAWALLGDSYAGHYGLLPALRKLKGAFLKAVEGRRKVSVINSEWKRIIIRGVTKVAAEGEPAPHDSCAGPAKGSPPRGHRSDGAAGGKQRPAQTVNEFATNDKGSALRLLQYIGDNVRWVPGLDGWYRWDTAESRWVHDPGALWIGGKVFEMEAELRSELYEMELAYDEQGGPGPIKARDIDRFAKYVHALGNVNRVDGAVNAVKKLPGMYVPGDRFDAEPTHMLCSNGVAVLGEEGLSFRPAEREDYLTLTTGFPHDPDVRSEPWELFLKRAVPDEPTLRWLQKAVGYSLLGANPERLFFVVWGKTSSGKSTFLEAIRHALGHYASTYQLTLFKSDKEQGSNVQKVRMLSKRFIVASEASSNRIIHADELKKATGGEADSARLNNSNEMVTRIPAYTPWLGTNDPPRVPGADMALWRRMWAIPFDQTIPKDEEDANYAMRLRKEASPAVLTWCLQGWDMYAREGLGDVPAAVLEATLSMRGELDDIDLWLDDACTREPGNESLRAVGSELYDAYNEWCERGNMKPMDDARFGRALKSRALRVERKRDGGTRIKIWYGIALGTTREPAEGP
jgi:putative DNA primase/helicase